MIQADNSPVNREAYRIEVPGPAKDRIMQFLQGVEEEERLLSASSRRRPAQSAAGIFPNLGPLFSSG